MALPLVFALLLAVAHPAPPPAAPAATPAAPAREGDVPAGAPTDDYQFVAWCHGALSGHMELYAMVKPELDKVSPGDDTAQMQAGRDYLALYERALKASEAADPRAIHAQGLEAEAKGRHIWAPAEAADARTRMWSWLLWELPGRCETAANRLVNQSDLFGAALRSDGTAAGAKPAVDPVTAAGLRPLPPQ